MGQLSDLEKRSLVEVAERAKKLAEYLTATRVPSTSSALSEWLVYLTGMKSIVGNSDNDLSLVAAVMARDWLCQNLPMRWYDAAKKSQNAPGLDIDEVTLEGGRVVGEVKTTEPYGKRDLGAAQQLSFRKDFDKLNAAAALHRFFFVTTRRAFEMMKAKYADEIPLVTIVLLPSGETYQSEQGRRVALPSRQETEPATRAAGDAAPAAPSATLPASFSSARGTIFPLTLHKTYLEQGFFNVRVDFDRYVRPTEGDVTLVLIREGKEHRVHAKVNRTANGNGTARIMGGSNLREWFLTHFDVGEQLDVAFLSAHEIRIEKAKT